MTIRLHPQAEDDLSNALNYYSTIDESLETKFLNYLESTFAKIAKFPYIILYEQYDDFIMILAIFNTKRDPETLMK